MKKRAFIFVVRAFIYLGLISISLSTLYFYLYSRPKRFKPEFKPSDLNITYHQLSVINKNTTLKGWFIPNDKSKKALILMHGWPSEKSDIFMYTYFLSDRFNLLYIDLRGLGESNGYVCGGKDEIDDIRRWIEVLKSKGIEKIGLFGYSYGAYLAVKASSKIDDLSFVIADSPFDSIRSIMKQITKIYSVLQLPILFFLEIEYKILCGESMNSFEISSFIERIKTPTLIICGDKDEICYNDMIEGYSSRNRNVEVVIMKDLTHGETLINKRFKKEIDRFLGEVI